MSKEINNTQMAAGNMTYAEAKKRFKGVTLVKMADERRCLHNYGYEECSASCFECEDNLHYKMELRVDDVHATRRSFLLELDTIGTTVVVSKDRAENFEIQWAELSTGLAEQVDQLGLDFDEASYLYCRTWTAESRRYGRERTFILPCDQKQANCLTVFARRPSTDYYSVYDDEKRCGGSLIRRMSYSEEAEEQGRAALDFWRFQYDPEADTLVVPPDELDESIDRMIELLEAGGFPKNLSSDVIK